MDEYQEYKLFKTHPYVIVDATLRDEIPENWEQCIIAPQFLGEDTERCPLLVDMRSLSNQEWSEQLKRLAEQTQDKQDTWCSLLLASESPLDKLARHLARRLVLQLEGDQHAKQFRYFDPNTFTQLPEILGEKGMAWLMGPVTSIGVPWAGEFTQYVKPALSGATFVMTETHYQSLYRVGIVNRVQNDIDLPDVFDQQAWLARAKTINALIDRALHHNILDQPSIVLFCKHALLHHPRFYEHLKLIPIFTALNNQVSTSEHIENSYLYLIQDLNAEDWQHIEQDLSAQQNNHDMDVSQESQ